MMLFSLPCYIFKPIKICISVSVFTLGKQAKHHACEPAYHLGGHLGECSERFAIGRNLHVVIVLVGTDAYVSLRVFQFNGLAVMAECSHTDI